ncbi:MAG: hypothetical protein MJ188_11890 [Treponema sp.]|nr:hypothetical protein [Treponema sp.]
MKIIKDKILFYICAAAFCIILMLIIFNQKQFRRHVKEVQNLTYNENVINDLEDGIYFGKASTSFLVVELKVQIENHEYKNIEVVKASGRKSSLMQDFCDGYSSDEKFSVPNDKYGVFASLVFLSAITNLREAENE